MASPTLGHLYPEKDPVLILKEAEFTPGRVWTRTSEAKSPPRRYPALNPVRPARSESPGCLSQLVLL